MNYLRISNDGLICPEDLTLIGSSTKREQSGKIGMFGSGWKYSLAWLIRNGLTPQIFSANQKIEIDFAVKMHRTNAVNVITVNGEETSLTTEMGPKWTGWMAIREILSNAIDEGGHSITTSWLPEFKGEDDKTLVYIPMNGELSDVMLKYDSYFAFNRKESFKTEDVRMFFKTEPSQMNIYRKGIRCYDTSTKTKVDFDFTDININEDRLTSNWDIQQKIRNIIDDGLPTDIFKRILREEKEDWLPYDLSDKTLANLTELCNDGCSFTTTTLQKLGGMLFSNPDALLIRAEWYKKLQDLGLVQSPFEFLNENQTFIRTDLRSCEDVKYFISGFGIDFQYRSGKCEVDVFVNGDTCYIKDDTTKSAKELAAMAIKKIGIIDLMALMK